MDQRTKWGWCTAASNSFAICRGGAKAPRLAAIATAAVALSACAQLGPALHTGPAHTILPAPQALPQGGDDTLVFASAADDGFHYFLAREDVGLYWLDTEMQPVAEKAGPFDGLSMRAQPGQGRTFVLGTVDERQNEAVLMRTGERSLAEVLRIPSSAGRTLEGQCLGVDDQGLLNWYLVFDDARIDQHLIQASTASHTLVRQFVGAPGVETCAIDDRTQTLYVVEPKIGVWAIDARAESENTRRPVDLMRPFGQLRSAEPLLTALPGAVIIADGSRLLSYQLAPEQYSEEGTQSTDSEIEMLSSLVVSDTVFLIYTTHADRRLRMQNIRRPKPALQPVIAPVASASETEAVAQSGDAADDPAIWVHPKHPENSRILGTNKQAGLEVYDLSGQRVQFLASGRLNNVDVRTGFRHNGKSVDLAIATHRDSISLAIFLINPQSGEVEENRLAPTSLDDIYGGCMYRSGDAFYAIVNDKDGRYQQYALRSTESRIEATMVREFALPSQPEGCVADDNTGQLFMGEEDQGVWVIGAQPDAGTDAEKILHVGAELVDDVEGIAIYTGKTQRYLVISSQGNDSYAVFNAQAPWTYRGSFRVGANLSKSIDGASETDGLDVSSINFGPNYPLGLLVVQDGRNLMPPETQNFKLVSWEPIAELLKLP